LPVGSRTRATAATAPRTSQELGVAPNIRLYRDADCFRPVLGHLSLTGREKPAKGTLVPGTRRRTAPYRKPGRSPLAPAPLGIKQESPGLLCRRRAERRHPSPRPPGERRSNGLVLALESKSTRRSPWAAEYNPGRTNRTAATSRVGTRPGARRRHLVPGGTSSARPRLGCLSRRENQQRWARR